MICKIPTLHAVGVGYQVEISTRAFVLRYPYIDLSNRRLIRSTSIAKFQNYIEQKLKTVEKYEILLLSRYCNRI